MFSFVNDMNGGIFVIGIGIVVISILIYVIKNFEYIKNKANELKSNKVINTIYKCIFVLIVLLLIYYIVENVIEVIENIEKYKWSMNNDEIIQQNDELLAKEYEIYKTAISKEYDIQKAKNPYIPEGFTYVEGEWNNGFVIQDENENQYVWVPCTNKTEAEDGIEKLERRNFSNEPFISKDLCINEGCEKFINSSFENGGFYISRYEIGIENDKYVSKADKKVLSNITKKEATEIVNKMNTNEKLNSELINGYAYDTVLAWLKNTNDIKISKYEDTESLLTGREKYNNIYDFIDNIMEMTSETSYENVIIRGFLFEELETDDNYLGEIGYGPDSLARISIREEDNYYTIDNIMGLRTILYK